MSPVRPVAPVKPVAPVRPVAPVDPVQAMHTFSLATHTSLPVYL